MRPLAATFTRLLSLLAVVGFWLVCRPLHALPLQEVIDRSKPAVAQVSILSSEGLEVSSGSGFLISSRGRLVTNFHVVENSEQVVAVFEGGRRVEVQGVLAYDVASDLAIVQLAGGEFPFLVLSEEPPKQGDPVTVIGSPKGFSGSVSTGIISAIRSSGTQRSGIGDDSYSEDSWQLQITAATSPGSSGSPILSELGEVVGIAVGKYHGEALNFGVPVALLRRLVLDIGEPQPLSVLRTRRSLSTNLLISAVVLLGLGALFFGVHALLRVSTRVRNRRA